MNGTNKAMTLCRPCAEGLKAAGRRLAALTMRTQKHTCEGCGRRRFTRIYAERRETHAESKPGRPAENGG